MGQTSTFGHISPPLPHIPNVKYTRRQSHSLRANTSRRAVWAKLSHIMVHEHLFRILDMRMTDPKSNQLLHGVLILSQRARLLPRPPHLDLAGEAHGTHAEPPALSPRPQHPSTNQHEEAAVRLGDPSRSRKMGSRTFCYHSTPCRSSSSCFPARVVLQGAAPGLFVVGGPIGLTGRPPLRPFGWGGRDGRSSRRVRERERTDQSRRECARPVVHP